MKRTRKKTKNRVSTKRWKQGKVSKRKSAVSKNGGINGKRVGILLGVIGVVAAVWFVVMPAVRILASHPAFTVANIVIEGAEYLDREAIASTVAIDDGATIFNVDMKSIADSLEHEYPAEDFTVYKRLPGTVVIKVHESTPVALLNVRELVGVDKNGKLLPHVGAERVGTLPIITGVRSRSALDDSSTQVRLLKGIELLGHIEIESPSIYKRISEVDVTNLSELGISLVDNRLHVIIGDKNWDDNIPHLGRVVSEVTWQRKDVRAVDIRFGDKIIVRR